jgi:ferric-dicitrate binding protein FerR (iron transport regulator)
MKPKKEDHITVDEALLFRYFSGKTSPEENLSFYQWLKESGENQHIAEQVYYIKYAGDTIHAMNSVNAYADLEVVRAKIRRRRRRHIFATLQRVAAVLFLILLPTGIYWMLRDDAIRLPETVMVVPEGSLSSVILPDGSHIWINAGSKISYESGYGIHNRRLHLTGEAFFDVQTNPALPFEVHAGDMTITAKGTQFNIKAYPEEQNIWMLLAEGRIEISSPKGSETMLRPGQMAVFDKTSHALSVESGVGTSVYTSWKDKRWLIEGSTLGELAPILQRRYAVKVVFSDEVLKDYKFRGEIQNLTVEQLSRALQMTAPMDYEMRNDTVFFRLNPVRKRAYDKIVR